MSEEWEVDIGDMVLRGKRWRREGGLPVLALHGWLDNCASFDFLAPRLMGVDLVAVDLAGQGKSDHRKHSGAYNIWLDVMEVISVANALGWDRFGVIGHSRGAMISTLLAGTFPERVSHLALIESFAPQIIEAKEAPEQLASSILALINLRETGKGRTAFSSFEAAVRAREKGFLNLVHEDALVLAKRGVVEQAGKFIWNNDPKLNAPSEVKMTMDQARAFVDRIDIPISLVLAESGLVKNFPVMEAFLEQTENLQSHWLPGDHHLHMSQQCQRVAEVFNEYFSA